MFIDKNNQSITQFQISRLTTGLPDYPITRLLNYSITRFPISVAVWARILDMTDVGIHIRCMRCGTQMDMRDPGPDMPWTPDQFWVCPKCGRHFWTTYPPPNREKVKPASGEPAA